MENKKKDTKKGYAGKQRLLVLVLIFLITIFGYYSYRIWLNYTATNQDVKSIDITSNSRITYNVLLKDNEFITEKVLGEGKTYIYELVDDINMKMQYEYLSSEKLPLASEYKVIATIFGLYNENPNAIDNPIIWEKEYIIKDVTSAELADADVVKITESFKVNLNKYNAEALEFKTKFSIPTRTYLEIKMPVTVEGESKDFIVSENYAVVARIPLAEKVVNVEAELDRTDTKNEPAVTAKILEFNLRDNSVNLIMLAISIILILIVMQRISYLKKKYNFESYLLRLKKDYGEILIETNNMPDVTKFKPISITNFEEILNLSNSLNMPIMLFEKGNIACFYILKNEILYSYILNTNKGF